MSADTFDFLVAQGYPFLVSIRTDGDREVKSATVNIRQSEIDLLGPIGAGKSKLRSLAILAKFAKERKKEMDAALRIDFITRMKLPGTTVTLEVKEKKLYTYLVQGVNADTLLASEVPCPECGDHLCESPGL